MPLPHQGSGLAITPAERRVLQELEHGLSNKTIAAVLIVFIPTVGDYVTPDLIGGGKLPMIANRIEGTMLKQNNREIGSAIAVSAMLVVAAVTILFLLLNRRFLRGTK